MKRKEFIKLASTSAITLSSLGHLSFNLFREPFFKLSLAQWSFNKSIRYGSMSPYSFAKTAKDLGFGGLEYVNQLYKGVMNTSGGDKITSVKFWAKENSKLAKDNGIENVLIMIDSEGDLADENRNRRNQSIDNHKLWVDAANESGCKSIRVNLHGTNNKNKWKEYSMDSLTKLASYAQSLNINVIVENHGQLSSNIPVLMEVINSVNMKNCGTLPDFGNFCMVSGYGNIFGGECPEIYDLYKGVEEMMPKAYAVSAKSNDFDSNGNEKTIDYEKMLRIVKNFGYNGFIGVEYEGSRLSEIDGIKATRDLLIKIGQSI